MCGIFGIVYRDGQTVPSLRQLNASRDLLQHRGPDSSGVYWEAGFGLAHTRLSLVDLNERSQQPFWDTEGRFCLVYNGEIYNFMELRKSLENRGTVFRTTSDTEVLLHSLIVDGPEATLPKLEGMFAFALFDKRERSLVLARDRFGMKPLSVYQSDEIFLFASEIKAMRPWIEFQPNAFAISSFLLGSDGPAQNASFYEGVRILPPGSLLKLRVGEAAQVRQYTSLTDMIDLDQAEQLRRLRKEQVVDLIDELLQKSVQQMMFADASVGALCSGGVDSSLLLAMAVRDHRSLAIFHADVLGPGSEYEAAQLLSRHLKLDLQKVDVRDQDFIDLLPDVMAHYEHPYYRHHHSVPFLMVSRLVQAHGVKGVLTGEGADECFLGYQFIAQKPFRRRLRQIAPLAFRIRSRLAPRDSATMRHVADLLGRFEISLEKQQFQMIYANVIGRPNDNNVTTLNLLSYHLRTLLHRNDTMGMAASIEARFPFLSERLVKTAINLPYKTKIRFSPTVWERAHPFLRDKWVLRKVADRYLPKSLSQRKKWPFTVTAYGRMRIPNAYFDGSFVADYFGLAKPELAYLLDNAEQNLKIKLLKLDVWCSVCLEGEPRNRVREKLQAHLSF